MERRNGMIIMGRLVGLVKPLMHVMAAAILLGILGYLCAIFLMIVAALALVSGAGFESFLSFRQLAMLMTAMAVLRGILHYGEQAANHYIAFKLLAIIRHKVFDALRKLAPAKLEGQDKGNLVSIITSDIELLEVFYAHTISPIAIAFFCCLTVVAFLSRYHLRIGVLALVFYIIVGVILPLYNGNKGKAIGMGFREEFGNLNSFILDSMRGLKEIIQYHQGKVRDDEIQSRTANMEKLQRKLKDQEGTLRGCTDGLILIASFSMLFLTLFLYQDGQLGFDGVIVCTVAMISSFGPVVALANLSNHLNQTLASGERVLSILEEAPLVDEVTGAAELDFESAALESVDFSYHNIGYDSDLVLENHSLKMEANQIYGIWGSSGSGKSTILKLLMRFFDVQNGTVKISDQPVQAINTHNLRNMEGYVTQETYLFHDTIKANIGIAKPDATMDEIIAAAKQASVHEFISGLPDGYESRVGELGDSLSGGERQRIGIARVFLHDAPFILLDEPTSNLDSLNEGMILKSLKEARKGKTILLVSHRKSTLRIADCVFEMSAGN